MATIMRNAYAAISPRRTPGTSRSQSASRANLQEIEPFSLPTGKVLRKVSPLAGWTAKDVWAYAKANELGRDPQPGLALLRLAEGKIDAAVAGITCMMPTAPAEDMADSFHPLSHHASPITRAGLTPCLTPAL